MRLVIPHIGGLIFGAAALSLAAGPLPAVAEAFSMQPLQGGGQMFQNLPGVHVDSQSDTSPGGDCTEHAVTGFDAPHGMDVGTMRECNFGHFTIRTIQGNYDSPYRPGFPDPKEPFGHYIPDN